MKAPTISRADALRGAAAMIRMEPHRYNYSWLHVPEGCNEPACMLGFIGIVAGHEKGISVSKVANWLGYPDILFYKEIRTITHSDDLSSLSPERIADALDILAERKFYHD